MKTLGKYMLRGVIASWLFFAFLLAGEVGLVPDRLRGEGMAFHWQIWLLAGILLLVVRDQIVDFKPHCRCCGSTENIAPLSLITQRELLCRTCLTWDPGPLPSRNEGEYADLVKALSE